MERKKEKIQSKSDKKRRKSITDRERVNLEDREGFTKEGIQNISNKEWIKGDKEKMEKETKEVRQKNGINR